MVLSSTQEEQYSPVETLTVYKQYNTKQSTVDSHQQINNKITNHSKRKIPTGQGKLANNKDKLRKTVALLVKTVIEN